jgi:transcriptional regulator GlxA family with amidase domain
MQKRKIIFLVLPHVHLLDLAGPDQVFLEANDYNADLDIVYCGPENDLFTTSKLGIARLKNFTKIKISKGDYVIIPGADVKYLLSGAIPSEKEMLTWLRNGYETGALLCSVCTGAFFLAKTGLLNGRKCTTHWKRAKQLKQKFPLVKMEEDILFTEDGRILTSAGVTAGIDMALFIVARLSGEQTSFKVARELVIYMRRQGNEAQQSIFMQYRNHIHSGIHKVQDYVQENIQDKITLFHLADIACMSSRNLTRLFKKETGITINNYITLVRKEVLANLKTNPDLTRKQMAALCGLSSERQVIRLIKE